MNKISVARYINFTGMNTKSCPTPIFNRDLGMVTSKTGTRFMTFATSKRSMKKSPLSKPLTVFAPTNASCSAATSCCDELATNASGNKSNLRVYNAAGNPGLVTSTPTNTALLSIPKVVTYFSPNFCNFSGVTFQPNSRTPSAINF